MGTGERPYAVNCSESTVGEVIEDSNTVSASKELKCCVRTDVPGACSHSLTTWCFLDAHGGRTRGRGEDERGKERVKGVLDRVLSPRKEP